MPHILTLYLFDGFDWPTLLLGAFIGAIVGLMASGVYQRIKNIWFGIRHLKPRAGKYKVYRKSGDEFKRIKEVTLSWRFWSPLVLEHSIEMVFKEAPAMGEIHFRDAYYGEGYHKHEDSHHYGTVKVILFGDPDTLGYQRTYTKEEENTTNNPDSHKILDGPVVVSSFVLEKIKD